MLGASAAHATGPDDCAIVIPTRDGFLNVREAPTMKSKIVAKLHPMDLVWADAYECIIDECEIKGWTHIGGILRSSGDDKPQRLRGWVGTRYLKIVAYTICNDIKSSEIQDSEKQPEEELEPKCDIPGCDDNWIATSSHPFPPVFGIRPECLQ